MARGSVTFVLGIHNHQPLGNFDSVFEEAYHKAYLPFLERVERHPGIRFALHNTGILLDWFAERHPEMLERIATLIAEGRVEPISGGYYEPIMPPLPDRDKIGQIRKLSGRIKDLFGVEPVGMWLAERVWEPHLPKPFVEAGMRYLVMDDSHFKSAGLRGRELYGYYRTEEQGYSLAVFPIDQELRYLIPFQDVEKTRDYLARAAQMDEDTVVVMADDGEKFGIWPKTHQSVYVEGWLDRFFAMLETNRDWIRMKTFSEVLQEHRALGNVYIPSASYTEMMEWVLPAARAAELEEMMHDERSVPFRLYMRGGSWRSYFSKYAESNSMHKRMLYIGNLIDRAPKARRETALDALWRAQCNCAYWHGVFGGLYLNHLRAEVYRNLISAEMEIERAHRSRNWLELDTLDLLCTGGQCAVVRSRDLTFCVDAAAGGSIFELDYKPKRFNVLNTMTRRPEAYHRKLAQAVVQDVQAPSHGGTASIHDIVWAKEAGLQDRLCYDTYRRTALIDHFLPVDTTLADFAACRHRELSDGCAQPYSLEGQVQDGTATVRLERTAWIHDVPVRICKTISHQAGTATLTIAYTLENGGERGMDGLFGVEFGFALQAGNTPDRYYCIPDVDLGHENKLGGTGCHTDVPWVRLVEEWVGLAIDLSWSAPAVLWRFPIETISNSEAGFERVYQSSVVLPHWHLVLPPKGRWERQFELRLSSL